MGAPKGNKNAKGNSGGYGMPPDYRARQVELRTLMIDEMLKIMRGDNKQMKLQIIMKHGGRALPAEIEGMGEDGSIIVRVVEYATEKEK